MTTVSHEPEEGFQSEAPCLTSMDEEAIVRQLDEDEFFWLDLLAPSDEEAARLRDLRLHPMAVEDSQEFGQRPKLDGYGTCVLLVFYAAWRDHAADTEPLRKVTCSSRGRFVFTIHHDPFSAARA